MLRAIINIIQLRKKVVLFIIQMIGKIIQEQTDKIQVKKQQAKKLSMAALRLQKDLQSYEKSPIQFVKLFFPREQSLQTIHLEITLKIEPQQKNQPITPYNNTRTLFSLEFPDTYPLNPPKLKCLSKIYHPNINYNGNVCLPLVREDWSPTISLECIICGLIYILSYPNGQDALQPEIGDQMVKDMQLFKKIVKHTCQGRVFKNKSYDHILLP